jgi:isoleucyl-tRNA synthetase
MSLVPENFDWAELFICASASVQQSPDHLDHGDVSVVTHHKCGRCWRLLPEVPEDGALCARCAEVVEEMDQPA